MCYFYRTIADILLCQAKSGKLSTKHLTIPRTSPGTTMLPTPPPMSNT